MDGLTDAERAYDAACTELDAWEHQAQRLLDGEKPTEPYTHSHDHDHPEIGVHIHTHGHGLSVDDPDHHDPDEHERA